MSTRDDGGPAFPFPDSASPIEHPGMTVRDYAAIEAMKPLLQGSKTNDMSMFPQLAEIIAKRSYQMADAMIAERNRRASP